MKYLGIIALGVALAGTASAGPNHMPPRAFLTDRVQSVDDLVAQLEEPSVREVYEKHYGATRADIERFFRSLHIQRFGREAQIPVYYFDRVTGAIDKRRLHVHANELVFATASGIPVLMVKCGNPLGKRLWMPAETALSNYGAKIRTSVLSLPPSEIEKIVESESMVRSLKQNTDIGATGQVVANSGTMDSVGEVHEPSIAEPGTPDNPVAFYTPTIPAAGGGFNPGALLAGVPLLGLALGHGGSGGGTVKVNGGTVVPEPASIVVVGLGVASILRRRRK